MGKTSRFAAALVACGSILVACGSENSSGDESTVTAGDSVTTESAAVPVDTEPAVTEPAVTEPAVTEPAVTEPDTTAAPTTETAAPNEIESTADVIDVPITGGEFFFDTAGVTELPAGTIRPTFTLNADAVWDHVAMWVRVKEGHTVDEVLQAAAADFTGRTAEPLLDFYGGSNAVGPGQSQTTYLNLDPGTYILADFIPAQDGTLQPHSAKGMWQEMTVTDSARPTADVESEGKIVMADMTFSLPDGFDGNGVFEVRNDGDVLHEMGIVRLVDGKTSQDIISFFDFSKGPPTGPRPYTTVGGMGALSPGKNAYIELALEPGNYALISFITDAAFKQQLSQGMNVEFTIE